MGEVCLFLNIPIELKILSQVLSDLSHIYRKFYPYSEKSDFVDYVFGYTLYDLKQFISKDFVFYGDSLREIENFDFYYWKYEEGDEFCDYVISNDKDIKYYKQYFKKVVELVENFDYNSIQNDNISVENNPKLPENDFELATIEDYLAEFKEDGVLQPKDYKNLVDALYSFFTKGHFPIEEIHISVKKTNKKRFGWALSRIYFGINDKNEKLPVEYLTYIQSNISIFQTDIFHKESYLKSRLYKYLTTNT